MELSRLYGVSVDELLSLEEAEKGDAKAASSVDDSTPAPAQETLAALKKVRRQKLLLGAAAVCLTLAVGLALYNNHRVKQLERQVSSLQSQIMSVQSSLSSQIAGISSSVREAMEESATLTAQFDYTVKRFDLDAYTCTVAFALQPKTVQDPCRLPPSPLPCLRRRNDLRRAGPRRVRRLPRRNRAFDER